MAGRQANIHRAGELLHQPYPIPSPAPSPSELGFVQHQSARVCVTGGNAVAVGAESVVRGAQCTTPTHQYQTG
jgi:hypothetical protein